MTTALHFGPKTAIWEQIGVSNDAETVKLKRDWITHRHLLAHIRQWLMRPFDDSQQFIDESQRYLKCINQVLGHENEVDEFLVGADDDCDYQSPVSTTNDASGGRSDSGGVA